MNQFAQSTFNNRHRSLKPVATLFALLLFALSAAPSAQASDPKSVIHKLVDQTISMLSDKSLSRAQRLDRLRALMRQNFNFNRVSRSVLAKNWKAASAAQQNRFEELFPELLLHTYLTSLESYSDEKVEIERVDKKGKNKALVATKIVSTSKAIPVIYRLREEAAGWKIYDIAVEGVSMVSNYRSSYAGLIKNHGMQDLLAKLEQKLAQLRNR